MNVSKMFHAQPEKRGARATFLAVEIPAVKKLPSNIFWDGFLEGANGKEIPPQSCEGVFVESRLL